MNIELKSLESSCLKDRMGRNETPDPKTTKTPKTNKNQKLAI